MKKITILSAVIASVLGLNWSVFAECYIAEGNGCKSFNHCGLFQKGDKCVASLHGSTVGDQTCENLGVAPAMGWTCGDYFVRGPGGNCTKGSPNGCGGPYPAPCP